LLLDLLLNISQKNSNAKNVPAIALRKKQEPILKEIIIFKGTLLESSAAICCGDGSFSFLKKSD
jgi:hypothetical protein